MLIVVIVLAVIAVLAFIGFTAVGNAMMKSAGENTWEQGSAKRVKRFRFIIPAIAIVLIVLLMVLTGIRILDATEIGVVKTFGEINRTINSGLNFINPISDSVENYDLTTRVRERTFASYTKDAQPLTATVEYQYELIEGEVLEVAREYGSYEKLESKLDNLVEEKAKVVMAHYSAMPLLENRSNLSAEVAIEVETLESMLHINFKSVIVKDIDFSDAFEASVEAKMTAEQDAMRAEQEKKTAVIKAEQAAEVAAIEAEAAVARAKGEAEALEITRGALQNMPDTWIASLYLEKWNGVLPEIMTEGSSLMINPDLK